VVLPLVVVFVGALRTGFRIYFVVASGPDALSALRPLWVSADVVPLNLVLGALRVGCGKIPISRKAHSYDDHRIRLRSLR